MMEIPLIIRELSHSVTFMLIHSIWQAFVVFAAVKLILLILPERMSYQRYLITTLALAVFAAGSVVTFLVSMPGASLSEPTGSPGQILDFTISGDIPLTWESMKTTVLANSATITVFWLTGSFLFLIRLLGGIWYVRRIVANAVPSCIEESTLLRLRTKFNLRRVVRLVESTAVDSPVVTGVLKPIIVFPVGMATGLSTDQVEAILLHELIHIKRHDYVLNLVQTVLESIFFFNPFVWLLSGVIRREREHCCDDAVLAAGADKSSYVLALAALEEARLVKHGIALSLAENKHALLKRIKRLMEKSVRHYSPREKMIPVVLLIIGFVCASWFTINPSRHAIVSQDALPEVTLVAPDTIKPKTSKSKTFKQRVDKADDHRDQGNESDYSEEEFGLFPEVEIPEPPTFDFPEIPPFDHFAFDLPEFNHDFMVGGDWNWFEKEFNAEFSERFGEFFEKNEHEIREMLESIKVKNSHLISPEFHQMKALEMQEKALAYQQKIMEEHEPKMQEFSRRMQHWQEENQGHLEALEKRMREMEKNMKAFQKELTDELVKDGYLESSESADHIWWSDDGLLKVNGKEIRAEDREKYNQIRRKHFKKEHSTE